jgi:hypothetical protein
VEDGLHVGERGDVRGVVRKIDSEAGDLKPVGAIGD